MSVATASLGPICQSASVTGAKSDGWVAVAGGGGLGPAGGAGGGPRGGGVRPGPRGRGGGAGVLGRGGGRGRHGGADYAADAGRGRVFLQGEGCPGAAGDADSGAAGSDRPAVVDGLRCGGDSVQGANTGLGGGAGRELGQGDHC